MVRVSFSLLTCGLWIASVGCGGPLSSKTGPTDTASTISEREEASRIEANLAKLSDADRTVAVGQKSCPVSGATLGAMGVPIKVRVLDQDLWICCDGCKPKLVAAPQKFVKPISPAADAQAQ